MTGGAGFLGGWLCRALLDDGWQVLAVDNFLTGSPSVVKDLEPHPDFAFLEADVTEVLDVPGEVGLVMHLASPASPVHYGSLPLETMLVGSQGTMHALDLAQREGARFVLASTSEVYGDPLVHPQPETYWGNVNPVGPRSVYDEAKRYAESLTTAYRTSRGVDTAIARIFNTYGPGMRVDDGRMIPAFMMQALRGEPIQVAGDGSQTRSLCYVTDTARGLCALADSSHAGPVNLGGQQELTVLQVAEAVRRLTGSASTIEFVELPVDDPKVRRPDITRARELLGWQPVVPLEEGLRCALEWFESQLAPDGQAKAHVQSGAAAARLSS
ncbi:dTDP-glucose 4,6-dehydratase [Humibacillus xanthopallidus]|uniref:dTDP-glucose 4,6-dehydratase n=1 Tax=Humibacillus xanthopallidus TaxID=412689 RepID=A0A543HHU1_9MICO|nr:dTDP-glucose 4,6-dehydratase [Humibacillus xanthopallidus]